MKKINPYAVGVVAFSALVLFFVVAMFIGPGPKLRHSQAIRDYIAELEDLTDSTRADNRRLENELAAADCQAMAKLAANLHWRTGDLQAQIFAGFGAVIAGEGLLNRVEVDSPAAIGQNLAEIGQLMQDRSDLVERRLADCLAEAAE